MSMVSASAGAPPRAVAEGSRSLAAIREVALSLATALTLLGVALLPLLTPAWIHASMLASGGMAAGASVAESLALSDMTVNELLFGPGTFAITYDAGRPLFGAAEIGHMQDVRAVLYGFLALAALSLLYVGLSLARGRERRQAWHAIGRGAAALGGALVVAGTFGVLAFGLAFELFHRLLFPGGNWAFDPAFSNLVRMYPLAFWQLSAAAYGALAVLASLAVWLTARRRARGVERA